MERSPLLFVGLACIAVCVGTAVYPNINSSIGQILLGVAICMPMLAVPFVVLWYFGRRIYSKPIVVAFIFAMLAALGWWGFIFWESFLVPENSDPQGALVFLFAPLYSSIAAVLFGKSMQFIDTRGQK